MTKRYDSCVLGSSPVSLLTALQLVRFGKTVVLIEKESRFGGAWSSKRIHGLGEVEIESACHLIEHYSRVYELISDLSGVAFTVCDPQPIKIFPNGRRRTYFSKRDPLVELMQQSAVLMGLVLIRIYNRLLNGKITRGQFLSFRLIFERIKWILRYRVSGAISYKGIMEPESGFTRFVHQLKIEAENNSVSLVHDELLDIKLLPGGLFQLELGKDQILVQEVYLPESTELNEEASVTKLLGLSAASTKSSYWHTVVEIKAKQLSSVPNYIHFPGDVFFHRITRDRHASQVLGNAVFLVQTNRKPEECDLVVIIDKFLDLCRAPGVMLARENVVIHETIRESYFPTKESSGFHKVKSLPNLFVIPSIGDLAMNVALNPLFK